MIIITHFDELRDLNYINGYSNVTYFDKILIDENDYSYTFLISWGTNGNGFLVEEPLLQFD